MTKKMTDSLAGVNEKEHGKTPSVKNSMEKKDLANKADRVNQA